LAKQDVNGSFDGLMTSAGLLPLLSGVPFLELRNMKCPRAEDVVDEREIIKYIKSRRGKNIAGDLTSELAEIKEDIEVTINIQSAVDGIRVSAQEQTLTVKKGTTALTALERASKRDDCFRFSVKQTAWGPLIDKICNIRQNDREKTYWMFYVNGKMPSVGSGKYVLKKHDAVVFKYRKVNA